MQQLTGQDIVVPGMIDNDVSNLNFGSVRLVDDNVQDKRQNELSYRDLVAFVADSG